MFGPNFRRRERGMGRNADRDGHGPALMLMLVQQILQLDHKPPVTLGLIDQVLNHGDLKRIVTSGFIHVDDWHLYHNMMSFLWKGYNLEHSLNSVRFLGTVACLLILSHSLIVVVAFVLATSFQNPVLLNHNSPTFSSVYGFQVPTKYAAWLELVLIHYMVPRSSLMGHTCGILAGYIFVYSNMILSMVTVRAASLSQCVKAVFHFLFSRNSSEENARVDHSSFSTPIETDEELARRLQEEEYKCQQVHEDSFDPQRLSPSEIRRRRLSRFGIYD
ncbi:hypothetical protein CCR75_001367 [Bremia lactucae]|uniref:Peptidase S54 rhomboid domain-containing protein n=1 Tax=Bremia lactucae TaxID=4779 RepID=A0A976IB94_BRELC|nr:hypothetical protein CCR75_001367 [Bremia lactucae]